MTHLRLLFVVQRYGPDVRGGAEQAARTVAERLAARGHLVEVVTTTARSYVDWSGDTPAGTERLRDVVVHRLPVEPERDTEVFARLHHRLTAAVPPVATALERDWVRAQGPSVPGLEPWLDEHAGRFDMAVFFTYLYATTTDGLPAAARRTATALVPCAHDEPPLYLHTFDRVAHMTDAFLFLTPEEARLVRQRFRLRTPHHVVGLGAELGVAAGGSSGALATEHGLDGAPYLLYVGRIDPSKGTSWLADRFAALKAARPSDLKLVLLGESVVPPEPHDDVLLICDADDDTRDAAVSGAVALVHPSPFESFAMVVTEAWARGTPVIAFAGNDVLRGHVERSGGGLLVSNGAELGAAAELLTADHDARRSLGAAGRQYVEAHYAWPTVIERWERALQRTALAHHHRSPQPAPSSPMPPPLARPPSQQPSGPGAAAPTIDRLPPAWLLRPLAAVLGLLAGASVVGLLAAMFEVFQPGVVAVGSVAVGGPLAWASAWALPSWRSDRSVHLAAALVVAAVAAITLYNALHHGQHLLTDRDPGVYLTTAKHLAEEGDLLVPGPVGPFVDADGVSPNGAGFSNERDDGTLEPQFPHLTAVLLAMGALLTDSALFLLTPLIAGGGLLCLYGWASGVVDARWAALAVLVTGASMPFTVFARDTYSEPIAMVLVSGGLLLLHIADRSGRWPVWLLAGLVLGATSMARVDGYLYLAPVLLALALTARAAPDRRPARAHVALCALGLLLTSALGWWDTATFTGSYYDELGRRLPAMLGAAAAATAVGWLAAPALWQGRGDGASTRPEPTLLLQRALAVAAAALVAFLAWAYWIRPDFSGLPSVAREGMAVLSLLPQAGPLSMRWLEWYLGPVGLAAGVAGLVWLVLGIGRASAPHPARIAGLGAILVTLVLYLWTPNVTPDQPWAMRRFAPVALPGLAVGAAAACHALWGLRAHDGRIGRLRRLLGPSLAAALALATLGSTVAITWPVRTVRAQVPMRERMTDICEELDDDNAVLVPIDGILSLMMSVPVGVWCDVPSAGGTSRLDATDVAELAVAWDREGRDLVVLSSSATPLASTLLSSGIVQETIPLAPVFPKAIEPTITGRPDEIVVDDRVGKGPDGEVTFYLYELDLGAARRLLRASDGGGPTVDGEAEPGM